MAVSFVQQQLGSLDLMDDLVLVTAVQGRGAHRRG